MSGIPRAAAALALLLWTLSLSAGGPWTQPKGKGYFKLSEYWIVYDQHFTDQGLLDPNTTTGIFNTTLYAEYGLVDRWTATLNFPFLSRNYMNNVVSASTGEVLIPGEALNTVGDTDLGIKYGLNKPGSKVPMALSLVLGLPTGNPGAGTQGNLQTGDGEFNQILQFDVGRSFSVGKKASGYATAYAGFNHRTNGFSEEIRVGVESGVAVLDRDLWFILRLANWESLKNGQTAETITSTSIFANNQEFTSFTVEAAYYLKGGFGVSAAFGGAFRAEIVAAAPSFNVGLFYDMNH
jgi:hypothetical protein